MRLRSAGASDPPAEGRFLTMGLPGRNSIPPRAVAAGEEAVAAALVAVAGGLAALAGLAVEAALLGLVEREQPVAGRRPEPAAQGRPVAGPRPELVAGPGLPG